MKKLMLLVLMLFGIFSCSDDDAAADQKKEPLVSKITISNDFDPDQIYDIVYDAQNRIEQITVDGATSYQYLYNDQNYVNKMLRNDETYVVFHYNVNNIVSGYEFGDSGELHAVAYDAETNIYQFPPEKFRLNAIGDVGGILNGNINFSNGKGAFANIGGNNVQLINHFAGLLALVSNKMAVESVSDFNNDKKLLMETLYNEAGYPVQIKIEDLVGNSDRTVMLEY